MRHVMYKYKRIDLFLVLLLFSLLLMSACGLSPEELAATPAAETAAAATPTTLPTSTPTLFDFFLGDHDRLVKKGFFVSRKY